MIFTLLNDHFEEINQQFGGSCFNGHLRVQETGADEEDEPRTDGNSQQRKYYSKPKLKLKKKIIYFYLEMKIYD